MASKANLHEQVTEVQLGLGPSAHIVAATVLPGKKVTPLTGTSSGILTWNFQQAAEWSAGAVLSRAPWTIKVVAQGRGLHREGKERMLTLAEGAGAALQKHVAISRPQCTKA